MGDEATEPSTEVLTDHFQALHATTPQVSDPHHAPNTSSDTTQA